MKEANTGGRIMNIIPTKKALPLFSFFDYSQNKIENNECSFYSWHANYFTVNRKKVLVLVNELSNSSIVLADINAKNKKWLEEYVKQGIEETFSYSGISSVQIKKYFLMAGKVELLSNYNPSMISVTNNMIQIIKSNPEDIDFNTVLQPKIMEKLANIPYKRLTPSFSFSKDIAKRELDKLI